MNCLSDEIIQMFIDGELTEKEQVQVVVHLQVCKKCAEHLAVQRELSLNCKASISSLVDELTEIPDFIQAGKKKALSKKVLYRFIYPLAAASILLLFLLLPFNENNEDGTEIFAFSNVSGEIDANLPISDQEIEIYFYDENGKMID